MMNSLLNFVFLTTAILACLISSNKANQLECTSCSDSTVNHNNITCYFGGCDNAQINCLNSSSDCYVRCQHRGCQAATICFSESSTQTAHLICGSFACAFTSIISYRPLTITTYDTDSSSSARHLVGSNVTIDSRSYIASINSIPVISN